MSLLAYLLAVGIGIVLGALGGGGSILAVPIFVYVLHTDPKVAIAMSLPVVGLTSLAGAGGHWREGHLDLRQALLFGAAAMAGAYLGARLASWVTGGMQLAALAVVMAAAAVSMLRRKRPVIAAESDSVVRTRIISGVTGAAIGVLTGLLGVGGGFLFVPALVLFGGLPMKQAVGTSLLVIAMSSAAGSLGYIGRVPIDWGIVARFTAAAIAGIAAGVYAVRFVAHRTLQRAFGVFLLVVAGWMLYRNLPALRPASGHSAAPGIAEIHT